LTTTFFSFFLYNSYVLLPSFCCCSVDDWKKFAANSYHNIGLRSPSYIRLLNIQLQRQRCSRPELFYIGEK
jgi:hypothetical protein